MGDVIKLSGSFFLEVDDSIRWLEEMSVPIQRQSFPALSAPASLLGAIGLAPSTPVPEASSGSSEQTITLPSPLDFSREAPKLSYGEEKVTFSELILLRLRRLEAAATVLGLKRTKSRIPYIKAHISSKTYEVDTWADPAINVEIKVLRQSFNDDLEEQPIFIPNADRTSWHSHKMPFGEKVFDAFPKCRSDITEAGNCYAADNFTACVFHLTRVIEQSIRLLAEHLRVKLKRELDYEDWRTINDAIRDKLGKLRNSKRGQRRERELEFYDDVADRCQYFKEMWRDGVMHARTNYTQYMASDVLTRVKGFMARLAEKIKDKVGDS